MPERVESAGGKHFSVLKTEFERAARTFAERTRGRFDHLGVVDFSATAPGTTVVEIGAGTGNFLSLFEEVAERLVAVDVVPAMLKEARFRFPFMQALVAEGSRLPLRAECADVVASAQMLHHVGEPVPILKEMCRAAKAEGRILLLDQVATESFEEASAMNELDSIRDPSHAASRPPSSFRIMIRAAGMRILEERLVEDEQRLSSWMWPGEFPQDRIRAVRDFIERRGHETGMKFEQDGDDYVFLRRRIMLLASRN